MDNVNPATIDRILELAPAKLLNVGGFIHIDKDKAVRLFQPPMADALKISTLTGFIDLLESSFEGYDAAGVLVHVASTDEVQLIGRASDRLGRRQVLIAATRLAPLRSFKFNTYMPQEEFVIGLRSLFLQDADLDDLVSVAGNLASQAEIKQQDDGFSQQATVKAGVVRLAEKTINPRVKLTPFRTFLEAEQPASEYIFRIQPGNQCALFEADGGNWRMQAIQNVQAWLQNQMRGSAVAGVPDIPVIA
jgi:hypothetical protein